jgi:hypothetical protein
MPVLRLLSAVLMLAVIVLFPAFPIPAAQEDFARLLEADYTLQKAMRPDSGTARRPVTTQSDAAGGCDGVHEGQWGFHTSAGENPWWQVDLGRMRSIGRVVIWNRCDGTAARAGQLRLLLSADGSAWREVYRHDGSVFYGAEKGAPLEILLENETARFVRVTVPGKNYLHLDEIEVFSGPLSRMNLALGQPADQSSISQWSTRPGQRRDARLKPGELAERLEKRERLLTDPLLDFDAILFAKRVPGSFNHMSDQYFGWWSRPGGGLYILRDFKSDTPSLECISGAFEAPGSFLRPDLSYDGTKVLFAWCRYYPGLAAEENKLNKGNVPEDSFYHLFEMNIDGTGLRQLTRGKYNDFDGRYLPDGRIVFLSTRRGHAVQAGRRSAAETLAKNDLPEAYVRCGGGPERPCAVYTLHTINADGSGLCAISPFEMFEWTPAIAQDGTILYSRWDYVDRDNMPYMSLWSIRPDGTNARLVYGNFTHSPHCTFEPRPVPGSNKIIFTASGHHAQTMGSLVLLDPAAGTEGDAPVERLTPEVVFPEIEGWPDTFFANPWPLSEDLHLVSWGTEATPNQGRQRAKEAMGLYLYHSSGQLELLYRDLEISCQWPIPVRPRPKPPALQDIADWNGPEEGEFALLNVYEGLDTVSPGDIKALRIVAVPPKTHPAMNFPSLGITRDDPGKCVLGTVPVEEDGSAYFRVPAGVIVFFQALDENGIAVQTMRSATYVQPGQTLTCVGCHEHRTAAPPSPRPALAVAREASRITPGPDGSWPLRFDRLVQPVLDRHCAQCHAPASGKPDGGIDLHPDKAWETLVACGKPSLTEHVMAAYRKGASTEGEGAAATSPVLALLRKGHEDVTLSPEDRERLITWMDTYAQRLGSFGAAQEERLRKLRQKWRHLLAERNRAQVANAHAR